jgi:hypothetical protein
MAIEPAPAPKLAIIQPRIQEAKHAATERHR